MVMAEGFTRSEVEAILQDPQSSTRLSDKEKALFPFAEKATRTPWKMHQGDVQELRDKGCSDEEILEIVFVISKFNFLDRVADTLGAPLDYRQDAVEKELAASK